MFPMDSFISNIKTKYNGYEWVPKSTGTSSVTYLIKREKERKYVKISKAELITYQVEMLNYLKGKLPVPEVIEHIVHNGVGGIVMSEIVGTNFREYLSCITPNRAVEIYADAYNKLKSCDITHGDFCPLNIIIGDNERIAGFVDFEKSFKGKSQKDLHEAVFIITKHYGENYLRKFFKIVGEGLV